MAVADTYDAMTCKRAYRDALPREVAISELQKGSGIKYDETAVNALLSVLDHKGLNNEDVSDSATILQV
jgi:putative two-component system response regulator